MLVSLTLSYIDRLWSKREGGVSNLLAALSCTRAIPCVFATLGALLIPLGTLHRLICVSVGSTARQCVTWSKNEKLGTGRLFYKKTLPAVGVTKGQVDTAVR